MQIRRMVAIGFAAALAGAGAVVMAAPVARADTVTVTNLDDDGSDTSLRGVLVLAEAGDVIELVPGATYELTRCEEEEEVPAEVQPQLTLSYGQLYIDVPVTINGNGATIVQTCPGWRVILDEADSLVLNDLTITGGTSGGGGGGVRLNGLAGGNGVKGALVVTLVIRNTAIVGNCSRGSGGGIKMNTDGDVEIYNSTIADNEADDNGGGISHSHLGSVYLENSTVTDNAASFVGGVEVRAGDLTTVYVDIVDNSLTEGTDCGVGFTTEDEEDDLPKGPAPVASNVLVVGEGSQFSSFGTVVALRNNGDVNCAVEVTASSGYNYSDDASCFFDQATDTEDGADPQLATLGTNGGPTPTRLPALTSPLVDAIPGAACGGGDALAGAAITVDQRYLGRPDVVGQACDIGAVELQTELPPVIEPTFAG